MSHITHLTQNQIMFTCLEFSADVVQATKYTMGFELMISCFLWRKKPRTILIQWVPIIPVHLNQPRSSSKGEAFGAPLTTADPLLQFFVYRWHYKGTQAPKSDLLPHESACTRVKCTSRVCRIQEYLFFNWSCIFPTPLRQFCMYLRTISLFLNLIRTLVFEETKSRKYWDFISMVHYFWTCFVVRLVVFSFIKWSYKRKKENCLCRTFWWPRAQIRKAPVRKRVYKKNKIKIPYRGKVRRGKVTKKISGKIFVGNFR